MTLVSDISVSRHFSLCHMYATFSNSVTSEDFCSFQVELTVIMLDSLPLSDTKVSKILLIAGYFKREPKKKAGNITSEYSRTLQRKVKTFIDKWLIKGVPPDIYDKLVISAPWIFENFRLTKCSPTSVRENLSTHPCLPACAATSVSETCEQHDSTTSGNIIYFCSFALFTTFVFLGYPISQLACGSDREENAPPCIDEFISSVGEDADDTSKDFEGMPANFLCGGKYLEKTPSLKKILQHFAVSTHQKKSHMTYLLKLLIEYQPLPAYDSLPTTGQQLLYIDGRDVIEQDKLRSSQISTSSLAPSSSRSTSGQPTRKKQRKPMPLPAVIALDEEGNGQYVHFGLESALCGDSVGIYFKHADIMQYAAIYRTNPEALPFCLRDKVFSSTLFSE